MILFNERLTKLKAKFEAQLKDAARLNALIAENLVRVKVDDSGKQNRETWF